MLLPEEETRRKSMKKASSALIICFLEHRSVPRPGRVSEFYRIFDQITSFMRTPTIDKNSKKLA